MFHSSNTYSVLSQSGALTRAGPRPAGRVPPGARSTRAPPPSPPAPSPSLQLAATRTCAGGLLLIRRKVGERTEVAGFTGLYGPGMRAGRKRFLCLCQLPL
jgi:hypothetical protein